MVFSPWKGNYLGTMISVYKMRIEIHIAIFFGLSYGNIK